NSQTALTEQQTAVAEAVTFQLAGRALEAGDPQEALRLAGRYPPTVHYVVDDVSRSEISRLAFEFTPEIKDQLPDRERSFLYEGHGDRVWRSERSEDGESTINAAGASFDGALLADADHPSLIVTFDRETAVAARSADGGLCLLDLRRMSGRTLVPADSPV